jgi:hypothetical protein
MVYRLGRHDVETLCFDRPDVGWDHTEVTEVDVSEATAGRSSGSRDRASRTADSGARTVVLCLVPSHDRGGGHQGGRRRTSKEAVRCTI